MPRIALSFDNGPDPDVTPQVLDILRRQGIHATFFVLGSKLRDPALMAIAERAHEEGHWIGNHTFSHDVPLGLSSDPDAPMKEIGRTQQLLGDLSDERRLFRPFGGGGKLGKHLLSRAALQFLVDGQYSCVLWNVVPEDWKAPEAWVERGLQQCFALDWAFAVLHDLPTGAMDHLERFIERARDAGATFLQAFPEGCVPLLSGRIAVPMDDYVMDE